MIFDSINNIQNYDIDLEFISEYLKAFTFTKGKFDMNAADHFGIGLEYETKQPEGLLWEAHRKNLDIHCILKGEEFIEIADISSSNPTNEYQDDYQLFEAIPAQKIHLKEGMFLLLFPHEVHKTGIQVSGTMELQKIVFKKLIK